MSIPPHSLSSRPAMFLPAHQLTCFFVVSMMIVQPTATFWWSLGLPSFQLWSSSPQTHQEQFCSSLTFLTVPQRQFCQTNPKVFAIIHRSLRVAMDECEYQFRSQRWNCSIFKQPEMLSKLLLRKTPETAFIYALTSASLMHSVAKACAKGELTECGCEKSSSTSTRALPTTGAEGFEWGGCSDDLKFGRNVSTSFADGQEALVTRRRMVRMVNLHNNEAGRQAVERNVQLTCKCHGVSGSCTLRVCWRTLPEFRLIGSELRTKYASGTQVRFNRHTNVFKPRKTTVKLFNQTDLIFVQQSPSFCEKNLRLGSHGTQGRECQLNGNQPGSCAVLCCDRGYETIVRTVEEDCDCQFHWCCEVRCKRCVKRLEKHFCK